MEFKTFLPYLADYLPPGSTLDTNEDFKQFLRSQGQQRIYSFTDFMMMTLPNPRVSYYENSDFYKIQQGITEYSNQIIEDLGFFPLRMRMDLLS